MSFPPRLPDPSLPPPTTTVSIATAPPPAIPFVVPPTTSKSTAIPPPARPLSNFLPNHKTHQPQQHIPYNTPIRPKSSPQAGLYPVPVASSVRDFIPHRPLTPSGHGVSIAHPNPNNRPVLAFSPNQHLLRPPHTAPSPALPASAHPKATPSPAPSSKSSANGFKDPRDRGNDDTLIVVRDRKVRLSDGDSLYGLGRSWLRNGFPEEHVGWKSQYVDFAKTLPRPFPVTVADTHSLKGEGNEEDNKVDEENVEGLAAQDLLKRHIKRAKRVRLRAKEERTKRILRFRNRIALLLPPPEVEQFRNDSASGT